MESFACSAFGIDFHQFRDIVLAFNSIYVITLLCLLGVSIHEKAISAFSRARRRIHRRAILRKALGR